MLTIFKKLFGKGDKKNTGPLLPSAASQASALTQFESTIQSAKIEVARLSLAAIVAKFPEDVRTLVLKTPDEKATVALPMQTIVKQLPSGVVRMSLGSLHRQAPPGIFKPLPPGDKRMVEVPLSEVLKHLKPTAFKRRADQRAVDAPPEELALFNDRNKPKESTPPPATPKPTPAPQANLVAPPPEVADAPAPAAMRVVAPPSDFKSAVRKAEPAKPKPTAPQPAPAAEAPASPTEPPLVLPIAQISAQWPEPIRNEIAQLDPTTTAALPASAVKSGLTRGKISIPWGEIRAGLTPQPSSKSSIDASTELLLPLKVVAPAFLAQSKRPSASRKTAEVDETIPALFNKRGTEPSAPDTEAVPIIPTDNAEVSPKAEANAETPAAADDTAQASAENCPEPATSDQQPASSDETPSASAPVETPAEPAPTAPASTIGAAFGEPEKENWTPAELVARVAKLPGVAGAVIALQEGFQVAHALPEGINAETISAFLPQIFGRLNQYAGEMKLGEVDDLLFTTRGAHCLIYRLGTLYFAVLGQPGASLPWPQLRLVASELSRQAQK